MELEKTNRMNALFECYATLLTDKQMQYMELYYADDYSLGEIAETYQVSRQAVYDNLRRTGHILEEYERKLHVYSDYVVREQLLNELITHIESAEPLDRTFLLDKIHQIEELDEE